MAGEFTIDVNAKGGSVPLELLLPQDRCLQFDARHIHGRRGLKAYRFGSDSDSVSDVILSLIGFYLLALVKLELNMEIV